MNGDIAITMVYPIMKTIVHKGYDVEAFGQYASFDQMLLLNSENRIAGSELERLMSAAAKFTDSEYFGLEQGQITDFADLGLVGYVMMHCNTILDALTAYQRYNRITCSGFNLEWHTQGDYVEIRMFLESLETMSRHCAEDMASSLYRIIGRLANKHIPIIQLQFMHASPENLNPYREVFGVVPSFGGQYHSLRLPAEVLNYPVLYSDVRLREIFEAKAQEMKQVLQGSAPFSEQVITWIMNCLPTEFPTLSKAAQAFAISTRTLQSKLKGENTTFNTLSITARKEMAIHYLNNRELSVGDIAYALHFSEQSAFQNAFKKWTGMTPGQYRNQQQ